MVSNTKKTKIENPETNEEKDNKPKIDTENVNFYIGMKVDVLDSVKIWTEAEV
jgi:hypothetical protein